MSWHPSRRDLLKTAAAMPALILPASGASAALGGPAAANPAHFRFTLGDAKITVVSDGYFELPTSGLGVNADEGAVQDFLARHFQSTELGYSHTNHVVIEQGAHTILVDIGSGDRFLPTVGRLLGNLSDAGIDADAITHLAITHAHPDHVWGIRDDFDEALLPDAEKFIGEAEYAYWMQDGLASQVAPERQQFVVGAQNSLSTDGLEWTQVADGTEIAPGLRMIMTPGHTPGHMSLILEAGGEQLMILGDAMTHAYLNFSHPDWYNEIDHDGPETAATRRRLLDMAAADGMAVLGYHFPFPGVGHVMREGDAYRFVPALWQWE
ncbi:MBL fold metallo-hydrolase [Roseivivax sp. CAU 1753]